MKKSLLLLFVAFATLVASAQTKVEIDGIWYNLNKGAKQAEVTWGESKYSSSINIPSKIIYEGIKCSVTSIGDYAFSGCRNLTDIIIPEGVTSIGTGAFYGCSSLAAINIPSSVTSIENNNSHEFGYFDGTKYVDGVITGIGFLAFEGCSSLSAITVAEGNTVYDSRGGCNAIIETSSNTLIVGCAATIIPKGVTSIAEGAFYGCNSPSNIILPESVTSIEGYAFNACSSLSTIIVAEGNTMYDSRGGCNAIIETSSNTLIVGCAATIIPKNVASIEDYAFSGCSNLTDITIPEGVISIGYGAFEDCSNLKAITVAEGNTMYDSRGGCNAIIETSSNTLIVGCAATIIPEDVTSIGYYAFQGCSNLTDITIPEGVTSIGSGAFQGCSGLTTINIPQGVKDIENYTFSGCSSLTEITFAKGMKRIGYRAFENCSSLTNINIPKGVKNIAPLAFKNCSSLTTINIPKSVASFGENVFSGCDALNSIYCYTKNEALIFESIFIFSYDPVDFDKIVILPKRKSRQRAVHNR